MARIFDQHRTSPEPFDTVPHLRRPSVDRGSPRSPSLDAISEEGSHSETVAKKLDLSCSPDAIYARTADMSLVPPMPPLPAAASPVLKKPRHGVPSLAKLALMLACALMLADWIASTGQLAVEAVAPALPAASQLAGFAAAVAAAALLCAPDVVLGKAYRAGVFYGRFLCESVLPEDDNESKFFYH